MPLRGFGGIECPTRAVTGALLKALVAIPIFPVLKKTLLPGPREPQTIGLTLLLCPTEVAPDMTAAILDGDLFPFILA